MRAFAVALTVLGLLAGISWAVQVEVVNPDKYIVTTAEMWAQIDTQSITHRSLRWSSSNATNSLRISMSNINDNIWWRSSPDPGTCTNSNVIERFPLPGASLAHYAGPNGTTVVEIITPHGNGCTMRVLFYFTDTVTHIQVANFAIPLNPSSIKFTVMANCSWAENIKTMPDKPAPGVTPWVRGRRMFFSILFSSISTEAATPLYGAGPGWVTTPTFRQWVENVCATQNMSITPPSYRPMPDQYDPFNPSTVTLQYVNHNSTLEFLPWSYVDSGSIVRTTASSNGSVVSEITPEGFVDTLNMVIQLEFYNNLTYDPTITVLFNVDAAEPEAAPGSANANAQLAVNIAAAVAIPVVVVVAAVAIVTIVVIKRHRHAAEKATIASKMTSARMDAETRTSTTSTVLPDNQQQQHPPTSSDGERRGTWTAARTPSIA